MKQEKFVEDSFKNILADMICWNRPYNFNFLNPFQSSVAFHVETSHSIFCVNEITGFYKKCNTGPAYFSQILLGPIWKLCLKYECIYGRVSFAIKMFKKDLLKDHSNNTMMLIV